MREDWKVSRSNANRKEKIELTKRTVHDPKSIEKGVFKDIL